MTEREALERQVQWMKKRARLAKECLAKEEEALAWLKRAHWEKNDYCIRLAAELRAYNAVIEALEKEVDSVSSGQKSRG